jgi:hypothetical protein
MKKKDNKMNIFGILLIFFGLFLSFIIGPSFYNLERPKPVLDEKGIPKKDVSGKVIYDERASVSRVKKSQQPYVIVTVGGLLITGVGLFMFLHSRKRNK